MKVQALRGRRSAFLANRRVSVVDRGKGGGADESGFTLIELLMAIAIMGFAFGAISIAIITSLKDDVGLQTKMSDSHDAQIASAYFVRDIQSAQYIAAAQSGIGADRLCGPTPVGQTPFYVLSVEWNSGTNAVSYATETLGGNPVLVRYYCGTGPSTTPTSQETLVHGLSSATSATVALDCNTTYDASCPGDVSATALASTLEFTQVQMDVVNSSGFHFTLSSSPRQWVPASANITPGGSTGAALLLEGTNPGGTFHGSHCDANVNGLAAIDGPAGNITSSGGGGIVSPESLYSVPPDPPLADPYAGIPAVTPTTPGVQVEPGPNWSPTSGQSGIFYIENGLSLPDNFTSGSGGDLFYLENGSINLGSGSDLTPLPYNSVTKTNGFNSVNYQGVVLWIPTGNPQSLTLSGNSNLNTIDGTIYAPSSSTTLNGGGNSGGFTALALVVNSITCNGGGNSGDYTFGAPYTTTTAVAASPTSPSTSGQPVTFTATVTASGGPTPSAGDVSFDVTANGSSSAVACTSVVPVNSSGQASCTTSALVTSGSPYTITAVYGGGGPDGPSPVSPAIMQTVITATTTSVQSSALNVVVGQPVTYTATVTPSGPTGYVEFFDGGSAISGCMSQALNASSGQATCVVTGYSGVGSHSITAEYLGSPTFAASQSSAIKETVSAASTTTAVTSNDNPAVPNQQVTYTATVSVSSPGAGSPTGYVEFFDGGSAISGCMLQALNGSEQATCVVTGYSGVGSHSITAEYLGSANFSSSPASPALNEVVQLSPNLSNCAAPAGGKNTQTYTGTTNENSGTVTVKVFLGATLEKTYTTSTFSGSSPTFTFNVSGKKGDLTSGKIYTAQITQVDALLHTSNTCSVTFTAH